MKRLNKLGILVAVTIALVLPLVALKSIFWYYYPHGIRTCFLPCVMGALRVYASEHNGLYPDGTNTVDALLKLHPTYLGAATKMLSGLSGNRRSLLRKIRDGVTLTTNDTSWVYFRGFSITNDDQDGKRVLLYEKTPGVRFNGRRAKGRAVGFVDGSFRQVTEAEWEELLRKQPSVRDAGF